MKIFLSWNERNHQPVREGKAFFILENQIFLNICGFFIKQVEPSVNLYKGCLSLWSI